MQCDMCKGEILWVKVIKKHYPIKDRTGDEGNIILGRRLFLLGSFESYGECQQCFKRFAFQELKSLEERRKKKNSKLNANH